MPVQSMTQPPLVPWMAQATQSATQPAGVEATTQSTTAPANSGGATPQPASGPDPVMAGLLFLAMIGWSLAAAIVLILNMRRIRLRPGPPRVPPGGARLLGVMGAAALVAGFAGAQFGAEFVRYSELSSGIRVIFAALLSSAAAVCAILALLKANWPGGWKGFGLAPKNTKAGLLTFVVTYPALFWLSQVIVLIWQALGFGLDKHPLFKEWDRSTLYQLLAFVAAVVAAPIVEELLFRGILQSALLSLLSRRRRPPADPPDSTPPPYPPLPPAGVGRLAPPPLPGGLGPAFRLWYAPDAPRDDRPVLPVWLSIIGSAAVFAAIHEPFVAIPTIFVLALVLGWLYERTGSLWPPIILHALFNCTQFLLFLATQ